MYWQANIQWKKSIPQGLNIGRRHNGNNWNNDSGMIKNISQDTKTRNSQGKNNIGEKEEKATEEEY